MALKDGFWPRKQALACRNGSIPVGAQTLKSFDLTAQGRVRVAIYVVQNLLDPSEVFLQGSGGVRSAG